MTLMMEKNRRERIIGETLMAGSRLSGDNGLQLYLMDLHTASGQDWKRAVDIFIDENVGDGESFSGPDYEGISWGRVVGDLYTYYLPDLVWNDDILERDSEEGDDLNRRVFDLQGGYRFH